MMTDIASERMALSCPPRAASGKGPYVSSGLLVELTRLRHLLKPCSGEMKQVFAGEALDRYAVSYGNSVLVFLVVSSRRFESNGVQERVEVGDDALIQPVESMAF